MTPERWRAIDAVFQAALARAPGDRAAYLAQACGADAALRREVEALLAAHAAGDDFLERPAIASADAARAVLRAGGEAGGGTASDAALGGPPSASRGGPVSERLSAALAGRYAVERELGRGGMATVYLARDLRHNRHVAIKVLDPGLGALRGASRFAREIETAAGLTHPHIVPLHNSGDAGGLLYYVMPYVAGESLRDRLRREGRLPAADAALITREVADALDYAHRHEVVHRDVKPENVLLDETGHAHVADFGIARAIRRAVAESHHAKLTRTGFVVGTPAYMSPEQAVGGQEIDGRSDIYALGCVLYEMLAGDPPHAGPNVLALLARRLREAARPVGDLRPDVPAELSEALNRALALDPADRFRTAAEFGAALAAASSRRP